MKEIKVVCGIIYSGDKIFIARRKKGKSMEGYWEFPGGKIEDGESEKSALIRELHEEFGMKLTVQERIGENLHQYDDFTIRLIAYKCLFKEASFELTDHDAYEWVGRNDLSEYQLAPADLPLIGLID